MNKVFFVSTLFAFCFIGEILANNDISDTSGFKYNSFASIDIGQSTLLYGVTYGQYFENTRKNKTSFAVSFAFYPSNDFKEKVFYFPFTLKRLRSFNNHHLVYGLSGGFYKNSYRNYFFVNKFNLWVYTGYRYQQPEGKLFFEIDLAPCLTRNLGSNKDVLPWAGFSMGYNFNTKKNAKSHYVEAEQKSFLHFSMQTGAGVSYWYSEDIQYQNTKYEKNSALINPSTIKKQQTGPVWNTSVAHIKLTFDYQPDRLMFIAYAGVSKYFLTEYNNIKYFANNPLLYSYGLGLGYPVFDNEKLKLMIKGYLGSFYINESNIVTKEISSQYYMSEYRDLTMYKDPHNQYEIGFEVGGEKKLTDKLSLTASLSYSYKSFSMYLNQDYLNSNYSYVSSPSLYNTGNAEMEIGRAFYNLVMNDLILGIGVKYNLF